MKSFKSHLTFNRSQRGGILFLVITVVLLMSVNFFHDFSEEETLDISSSEIVRIQKEIDSLKNIELERRKPKLYPFNPNFISDFKAYKLGMLPLEFDRLEDFRSKDQWVNSAKDFQRVTGVSDSLLEKISPFFKFPEWVNKPKKVRKSSVRRTNLSNASKIDINLATHEQLQEVYGVGSTLSKRILGLRSKLGGFSSLNQLHAVWGLSEGVVDRIGNKFVVKSPVTIAKMNINASSASDIATIPGVSFDLAKEIWEFIVLRDGIGSFSELEKIETLTSGKLTLIELYLFVE